nr:formate dehydrogenase subunit alpha precursor [Nitratidesulfovibrio sp. HK-II]
MTNHWIDLKNSDVLLIMGSNAAENHPISFKWVTRAQQRGATLIHVDPRFTRTSAKADIYAPIRSGTDIVFFGGLIKHILDNELYFKQYVVDYTNASYLVGPDYDFKDGLFSGFNPETASYDRKKWNFVTDDKGVTLKDPTLKDPRCVLQVMRRHYARYDLKTVVDVTGMPEPKVLEVWNSFASTGKPDRAGTILYAMGQCQHTVGVQNIRALSMIQMLLGNIGIAGGGVNALRGESNVQGTTDIALLCDNLPGYLPIPRAIWADYDAYVKAGTPVTSDPQSANWWSNLDKYAASLMKAMYPAVDHKTAYTWLPKIDDTKVVEYSWLSLFERMYNGGFKGAFVWGQNPCAGGANAGKNRKAMAKLDWTVVVNLFENETSLFWKGPGVNPKDVKTEVFFLPACMSVEKDGSVANSGRWLQWREKSAKFMGDSMSDGDIVIRLFEEVRKLYKAEGGKHPEPILNLDTAYLKDGAYDASALAKRLNGTFLKDVTIAGKEWKAGQQVPGFAALQADGSTACGCWIFSGSYTEQGNMMARRDRTQTPEQTAIGLFPNWSYAWPANRRILYNRAGVDQLGKPFDPKRAVIAWNGEKWTGDVPDGGWKPGEKLPFIMVREGRGQLYGPGRVDGPLPEHYEPFESPLAGNPLSPQRVNPTALHFAHEEKAVRDPRFPYVCTTYRVTEQWQSGTMTRKTAWLKEMQPDGFCEMSRELAAQLGVQNGEQVVLESVRGKVQVVAIVTPRIKPFTVMGETVHQVGIPWQFGWGQKKNATFDSANLLSPSVGDPNTGIPETKVFMVNVRKAQPGKQG